MKAVVQRVSRASVSVDSSVVGSIGCGLLALVAAHREDTEASAIKMADRVVGLRIFNDAEGKMNLALGDLEPSRTGGSGSAPEIPHCVPRKIGADWNKRGILAISNFTVYGETAKNRRPSFVESAPYDQGRELFEIFLESLRARWKHVETGVFGAHMQVELVNDGPVTVILQT